VLLSPKSETHPRDSDKGSRGVSGKGPWSIFTDTPVIQEAFSMRQLLRVRNLRYPFLDIAAHPPGPSTFSEFPPHGSSRFTGPPQLDLSSGRPGGFFSKIAGCVVGLEPTDPGMWGW